MRPTHATCTRSSSGSPACRYRAASWRARGMKRTTSSSRASRSPSRWYRTRSLSSASLLASGDSAAGSPNRTAGVTCHISPFRGDVKRGGVSGHGGCVIHHLEPLLQAGDGENALHRLRSAHDHETPPAVFGALVGGDEAAQPGGVEERQAREVEDHHRRLALLNTPQLVLHLGDGGEVKLSLQGHVHESVAVLGLYVEDLHVGWNLAQARPSRELPGE